MQSMQLVIVNSRRLNDFSVGFLQTLVKLLQVEILELITCSATGYSYAGEESNDIK